MAAASVIWFLLLISISSCQYLNVTKSSHPSGICQNMEFRYSILHLPRLQGCVVVLGNLLIGGIERPISAADFRRLQVHSLREVTGFVLIYRVNGLQSLSQLFPNLARIRGTHLVDNYALVVQDVETLLDVGLYDLIKIDRGGVNIWGGPHTCYLHTVSWTTIAPVASYILTSPEDPFKACHPNKCNCSADDSRNFCWNNQTCQRFLEGPGGECHDQCLGCGDTPDECSVCRHYTHRGRCVSQCPEDTVVLEENQYCVTNEECKKLSGWSWNKTCVLDCPANYEKTFNLGVPTCVPCLNCEKICPSQIIQTLNSTQQAHDCVIINGSLTIYIRFVPGARQELRKYLSKIEEVTDYILIYGSNIIKSLDFLPSLRRIQGNLLESGKYSLVIKDMKNLTELFTPNVTKNLKIDQGKLKVHGNPLLCMSKIDEIKKLFPDTLNELDIPLGLNGYGSGCSESPVDLQVQIVNTTSALVMFSPSDNRLTQYTVLYVKLPPGANKTIVPETCSETEWLVVNVAPELVHEGLVTLTSLRPGATYAVCIEADNPDHIMVGRSVIVNFTLPFIKPEPPFIWEMVANSSNVNLRWLNHMDYSRYITHYELDVILIDIPSKDLLVRNHCYNGAFKWYSTNFQHSVMYMPSPDYERDCKSRCEILPSVRKKFEDHLDVCSILDLDCNDYESTPPGNSTFGKYVQTLNIKIGPRNDFQVGNLAPFRDYKIKLRACVGVKCSRSRKEIIKTRRDNNADVPTLINCSFNDVDHLSVKWEPPDITNGPLLAYFLQIRPNVINNNNLTGEMRCFSPIKTSFLVKLQISKTYSVRVCASTLGSFRACSSWHEVSMPDMEFLGSWLLPGILFSMSISVVAGFFGFFCNKQKKINDAVPLIDITSMYRSESEPPSEEMSDFMPLYSVPLNDNLITY